jgi:SAM-dependent methyltransferase
MIAPTLHCPCDRRFVAPAFTYAAPPAGETCFVFTGAYARAYDRCGLCGHWFGRHHLDLSQLYRRDYVDATYGGAEGLRRRFEAVMTLPPERSDNAARAARVDAFAKECEIAPGARLLDVGAGLGVFPAAMKRRGWQVIALELDPRMAAHIAAAAGVVTKTVDLLAVAPEDLGLCNAVTFNKVLEHVEDPVALLARCRAFMAKGAFVYIELPDAAAAVDGPGREEFFVEHHHVFSPASTALLAERAGFSPLRIERIREPSGKYTVVAFFASNETA